MKKRIVITWRKKIKRHQLRILWLIHNAIKTYKTGKKQSNFLKKLDIINLILQFFVLKHAKNLKSFIKEESELY